MPFWRTRQQRSRRLPGPRWQSRRSKLPSTWRKLRGLEPSGRRCQEMFWLVGGLAGGRLPCVGARSGSDRQAGEDFVAEEAKLKMNALPLLDWRRQVAALYAEVRATPDPRIAHQIWCEGRNRLLRSHSESPIP